ncbi:hypothetical protein, partial [uncultured Senegalimassilia sp.]|uniref:hypothetical protein n=1 Tax=uncultured Senegalimassilia sp. TaxID=1714350 RepID=UPI0025F0B0A6
MSFSNKKQRLLDGFMRIALSVLLVVSFWPASGALAFAQSSEDDSVGATASQARDYNYLNDLSKLHTPNGGFVWMLGVNTADADMPSPLDLAAGSYGEFFDFAAPADAQAARDAVAALYDGVDGSNVSVGTFELPGGKQMPADAELTAWWLGGENADPKVDPSKVRAFSWDGSSLTELAVTVGEEPTGALGGAKLAQVSPEPGRALVLVDTTSLTEKSQARDYNYLNDLSKLHTPNGGFVWML